MLVAMARRVWRLITPKHKRCLLIASGGHVQVSTAVWDAMLPSAPIKFVHHPHPQRKLSFPVHQNG